jgi:hypothetical protein
MLIKKFFGKTRDDLMKTKQNFFYGSLFIDDKKNKVRNSSRKTTTTTIFNCPTICGQFRAPI